MSFGDYSAPPAAAYPARGGAPYGSPAPPPYGTSPSPGYGGGYGGQPGAAPVTYDANGRPITAGVCACALALLHNVQTGPSTMCTDRLYDALCDVEDDGMHNAPASALLLLSIAVVARGSRSGTAVDVWSGWLRRCTVQRGCPGPPGQPVLAPRRPAERRQLHHRPPLQQVSPPHTHCACA